MFGLEFWFVFAIGSAFAGGFAAFLYKVAAVHHINFAVVNIYASGLSTFVTLAGLVYYFDFSNFLHPALFFAFASAMTFFATTLLKVESLKLIDSAIFFPLYKVFGPLCAIISGVIIFSETFTTLEWVGIILGLIVPILLVTKSENKRQENLFKGLIFVLLTSVIAAVSISAMKQGTSLSVNIPAYIVAGEFFMATASFFFLFGKHKLQAFQIIKKHTNAFVFKISIPLGLLHAFGAYTLVFAFHTNGPLGIVYTINALYILIPIVLSIIYYNEHWNIRKVIAIILSIAALGFFK